jgi:O-antigen/teichoic acid export membrane protein
LLRREAGGSFARNVGVMMIGTLQGQSASVLLAPILTRLYTPDQFGILSVYGAAVAILGVVAALGLEIAIPITQNDAEMANVIALSWLVLVGTTSLIAALAYGLPDATFARISLGPLTAYRWLLPLGFACMGAYYTMISLATRLSEFRAIAKTRISQGLGGPLSQIALGLFGPDAPGLAIGYVIGQSSGTRLLLRRYALQRLDLLALVSWTEMRAAARRFAAFPLFVSWARLLDTAGGGGILFVLVSALYSPTAAGFIFLSDRVIGRPLLIVSTSLLQVFTGEAGRAVNEDPAMLEHRFRQVVPRQAVVTAAWVLLANAAAAWLFPVFFGKQWADAVPYLRALSLAYFAGTVLHPVSTTLQMLERQVTAALWQVGRMAGVVLALVLSWQHGFSPVVALWLYSSVQTAAALIMLGLIANGIRRIRADHSIGPSAAVS